MMGLSLSNGTFCSDGDVVYLSSTMVASSNTCIYLTLGI